MRKTLHWILNFTNFLKNISFLPWWWLPFIHQLIHMLQWVRVRIYKLRRRHDGRSAEFKSEVTALFVFLYLCICMFLYFCICVCAVCEIMYLPVRPVCRVAEWGDRRAKMDGPSLVGGQVINTLAAALSPLALSLSLSLILATRHTLCHRPVCHRGRGRGWRWRWFPAWPGGDDDFPDDKDKIPPLCLSWSVSWSNDDDISISFYHCPDAPNAQCTRMFRSMWWLYGWPPYSTGFHCHNPFPYHAVATRGKSDIFVHHHIVNWVLCRFIVTHIRLSLRSRQRVQRVIIFRAVSFFLFLWLLFSGFSGCVAFKFASASQTVRDVANMLLLPSHNVQSSQSAMVTLWLPPPLSRLTLYVNSPYCLNQSISTSALPRPPFISSVFITQSMKLTINV